MPDGNDQLNQILHNTARTEERTRNIERTVAELQKRYYEETALQDERIAELETTQTQHKMVISGVLVAVVGALTAFYNWIAGLL